jgi:hypothetical protein
MQQDQFTIDHLRDLGFIGFVPLASLPKRCPSLTAEPGVYVVVRDPASTHGYLDRSVGGRFKGQDGTVDVPTLTDAWVPGPDCLYIGQTTTRVRSRVECLVAYGRGEPVGHRGGRYLWQLRQHGELLVAWQVNDDPIRLERELLDAFETGYGRLPFASLVRGRRQLVAA